MTEGTISGASAFLSRICLPVAEEFGLLLRDRVSQWRANNAAKVLAEAEALVKGRNLPVVAAHPRLVSEVVSNGSWSDEEAIQRKWGGLLESSCSTDGRDDSNLIFSNLLATLTSLQVRILDVACERAAKFQSTAGLPFAERLSVTPTELMILIGCRDIHRVDRELDHLRSLELIGLGAFGLEGGGLDPEASTAVISPTPLALYLYVRCQGYVGSPAEYWSLPVHDTRNAGATASVPTAAAQR